MVKKIVCRKNELTGFVGHGSPIDTDLADIWINKMNVKYPNIWHYSKIVE